MTSIIKEDQVMARKAENNKNYPVDINLLIGRCRNIESAGLGMSLKSENPEGNGVWFRIHHEMTRKSYGEKITVTMTKAASGTDVHIISKVGMPTQLTDGGVNKNNVEQIFAFLDGAVA